MGRRVGTFLLALICVLFAWMGWSAFQNSSSETLGLPDLEVASAERTPPQHSPVDEQVRSENTGTIVPPSDAQAPDDPLLQMRTAHEGHHAAEIPPPPRRVPAVDLSGPLHRDGFGRTILTWDLLASTTFSSQSIPQFISKLKEVDGAQVTLTGFMVPLDDIGSIRTFMLLEIPAGCFYCLVPDPTGIVLVELKRGSESPLRFDLLKVSGKLRLNDEDPEDFLYILSDAEISAAE